ncbi:MAG: Coenzyme F420 hydrogenase/dehydrogenase, beta subunit C-terminal domain [Bacteroidales bacterium]|nr:Coenzyme F420 hydrogenase/dehydrogenase, beta subunit C-terminal domain [Bacteroidales bacterium]
MIVIQDKYYCCGCGACVQSCPNHCVKLFEDAEGFLYPQVDETKCVSCNICEIVCPYSLENKGHKPIADYALINKDDAIRAKSSSGGVFYSIAKAVISQNGAVFGASFDKNLEVCHNYGENENDILKFLSSKYVQSRIESSYIYAESFLKEGRYVLFSGTPCQIAGLRSFLKKDYDNLYTVDIICHGVPSPMVWRKYLSEIATKSNVAAISFRDKSRGWSRFGLCFKAENGKNLYNEDHHQDPYMQLFLRNVILRPSCYKCNFRCGKSGSDITIADFWGIQEILPDYNDDKGVSFVLINTERGRELLNKEDFISKEICHDDVIHFNKAWYQSYSIPENRNIFFRKIKRKSVHRIYRELYEPERLLKNRIKRKILNLCR